MREIDITSAIAQVAGGAPLIDVRERGEWDEVHASAATLLPMSEIQTRFGELPEATDDAPLLVICHAGRRSAAVVDALQAAGIPSVSVEGGMTAWEAAGGDVVRPSADAEGEPRHDR